MNTNHGDFQKLLSHISDDMKNNVWFLPIRGAKKIPDVPKGTQLKGNKYYKLTSSAVIKRLRNGQNAGIYALSGGLMFLDIDVKDGKVQAPDLLKAIPETFTVQSRNGGFQYFFLNAGLYDNQELIVDGNHAGELRTNWQYVVCPGSYVTPDVHAAAGDGTYRVLKDTEISEFEGAITEHFIKNTEKIKEVESFSKKTKRNGKTITAKDIEHRLNEKNLRIREIDGAGIETIIWQIKNNVW